MHGGAVSAEWEAPCFLLSVRRFGLPEQPKLGGFDAIVEAVVDERAAQIFIELPLGSGDSGRLRVGDGQGSLIEVATCSGGFIPQSLMLLKAIRHLITHRRPRVWMSADVSLAPIAQALRALGIVRMWYQHFPDYTPPRSRFSNPFLSFVYGRFLRSAWHGADIVSMPSERMQEALSQQFQRTRGKVMIISNQSATRAVTNRTFSHPPTCDCTRWHVLLAASSTDGKFCIEEAVLGAEQSEHVHLLVTGQLTDAWANHMSGDKATVSFLGLLSDDEVRAIAKASDVGLALYRQDPSAHADYGDSLKIRMYAAEGLPIIASHHVWPATAVSAAGGALLVEDPIEWVGALRTLTTDPETKSRMGAAAYEWATSEYSLRRRRLREFKDALKVFVSTP